MRILLTIHQFLPDHASGTEILTLHTAHELTRRGHHVEIFTGYPAKIPLTDAQRFDSYEYQGLKVHRFNHQHLPMGDQTNIIEMEYRNELFGDHFARFLQQNPQDIVHVFHFARLSALTIDACANANIPTVFTPTDFWSVCPLIQLRLPDGSLCEGPTLFAANCVRHVVEVSQPRELSNRLRVLPNAAVAAGVLAIQNDLLPERWYSPLVRALAARPEFIRQRLNMLDRILAPTHLMENMLARNGIHKSRISYVPYGVDLAHIRRNTNKGTEPNLRVGFIGTIVEHKGAHLLINAVTSLPKEIPISLDIYGNMAEFPDFAKHLRKMAANDPRISFKGTFPNHEIGNIFNTLDCLVVPSLWYENTPLVIYSSMASGCPVVATDLGGMSEAVTHNLNGLLFEKGSAYQLQQHLKHLALNRPLVAALAAKTKIPKSIPQYADDLERIYAEIQSTRTPTTAYAVGG
ncbi:MAG: glycosyltransferase [Phycisphaerae bacterium]